MSFEQSVRVPLERVGVVIGKGGSTRKSFEEELGVVLSVDSKSGSVVVKWTVPRYSVSASPEALAAFTVNENGVPAVAGVAAVG